MDDLKFMEKPVMKSTLLSLLLLLSVTQLAHGAIQNAPLSSSLALKPKSQSEF
jgi:hypothetical protein